MDNDDIILNLGPAVEPEIDGFVTSKVKKKSGKSQLKLKNISKPKVQLKKTNEIKNSKPTNEIIKISKPNSASKLIRPSKIESKLKKKIIKKPLVAEDEEEEKKSSISIKKTKKGNRLNRESAKIGENTKELSIKIKKKAVHDDVFAENSFSSLSDLNKRLAERLENDEGFGFTRMTAIQKLTIPALLAGKDCFVKSQTGSGKTLAYAVPCVQKLSEMEPRIKRQDGPYAIILTPTRELAIQTYEVFEKLLKAFIWIVPGYIAGGEKRKSEKARLRKGINVLICTPGRLTDHLKHTETLSLEKVRWMIFDEADRLLDGGFGQDIKSIIDRSHRTRLAHCQSVLLSATMNKSVKQLVDLALTDPSFITPSNSDIGSESNLNDGPMKDSYVLPSSLEQAYIVMPVKQRLLTLIALILSKFKIKSDDPCEKMLIFLTTQDAVDFHYYLLDHIINGQVEEEDDDEDGGKKKKKKKRFQRMEDEDGLSTNVEIYRLHGNMSQQERTGVYKEFSSSKKALLLATDVAARGLHIPRLDCIVQYHTPGVAAEYVHRVGRTARTGQSGMAILFLLPTELAYLDVLKEYDIEMREMKQNEFMDSLTSEIARTLPEALHEFQTRCEEFVYSRNDVYEMATKAFMSFVRAYTTYPSELKSIFNVRSLHLGHLAKCFALRETPKELASFRPLRGNGWSRQSDYGGDSRKRQWSNDRSGHSQNSFKRPRNVDMSEYGSGFDSIHF